MALLPAAVDVSLSLSSSSSYYFYNNNYNNNNNNCMWRRPITFLGLLIPLSDLIDTNSNLKFNRKSAATISQIMSSLRRNNTSSSHLMATATTTISLNCSNDMITTSKECLQQQQQQHKKKKKKRRQQPVLLFDIMDTVVRDPFYQDIPAFFQMSFKELIDCKNPTAWMDFELGFIDEMEVARNFFKDGRPLDLEGLKNCMRSGYSYIESVEELLSVLKQNNYEMHALTNYPIWYEMIEDKLKLSTYLSWSFCSCTIGKRKPDPEFYAEVVRRLDVEPENCVFIDDRMRNVEAAVESGMVGLLFKDAKMLRYDLSLLGIQTKSQEDEIVS